MIQPNGAMIKAKRPRQVFDPKEKIIGVLSILTEQKTLFADIQRIKDQLDADRPHKARKQAQLIIKRCGYGSSLFGLLPVVLARSKLNRLCESCQEKYGSNRIYILKKFNGTSEIFLKPKY
jgi:hypothetical protein